VLCASGNPSRTLDFSMLRRRLGALGRVIVAAAPLLCGTAMAQEDPAAEPSAEIGQPRADEAVAAPPADTDDAESARLYATNAERREAGRKHPLTSWLTATALVELEWQSQTSRSAERDARDRLSDTAANAQVGLIVAPWRNAKAEAVLEYDSSIGRIVADEAFVSAEIAEWEIEAGRLHTPLGIYLSHFASGPLLEFAESSVDGALLSYTPADRPGLKLMGYRGKARPVGGGSEALSWAASVEARAARWLFGLSYQSDLADSREALLQDFDNRYVNRVGAVGGYAVWTAPGFDLTFEVVRALESFRELESDRDRPVAWNLEFVHAVHPRFDWALRWEGSRELADAPARQAGLALTWRPAERASLTVEYLHGWFSGGLATNEDGEPYASAYRIGAKLSVAF